MSIKTRLSVGILLGMVCGSAQARESKLTYLSNREIKVGVDLAMGGAIAYVSRADEDADKNVVNTFDLGREIQQSYYSGPQEFRPAGAVQHPGWPKWPWNPVQAGDSFDNPSEVLAHSNDGSTLYVKTRPKQWALKNCPADCTMEQWITLDRNVAAVKNRLTNARGEKGSYPGRHQELPAVYTNTTLTRLLTYNGLQPFAEESAAEIAVVGKTPPGPPWTYWRATEGWAAFVNESDWGLGVFLPGCHYFAGGYTGAAGQGTQSPGTGYMSPIRTEILDHDMVYEYTYFLILGSLGDIRRYVYDHRPEPRPNFQFRGSRQHWVYANASDAGLQANRPLRVQWNANSDPQMISAETAFQAKTVKKLFVRAAYHLDGAVETAQLYWETNNGASPFSDGQSLSFQVVGDGRFRTYALDLASNPQWKGLISRLRFDPVGQKAGSMDLAYLSFTTVARPPAKPRAGAPTLPAP